MSAPKFDACFPTPEIIIPASLSDHRASRFARYGVMIHFDASRTDAGAESWFRSPSFTLSYHRAYTDAGRTIRITPAMSGIAAYHAGICRQTPQVSSANDAFYAFCITADNGQTATDPQFLAVARDTAIAAAWHIVNNPDPDLRRWWNPGNVGAWLVGHNEWAIFNPRDNPRTPKLWGKLGRKIDPIGSNVTKPVLSLWRLRNTVREFLETKSHDAWSRVR